MTNVGQTKAEVERLLREKFPKSAISRVDVEEISDSDGEPSLGVWVVFRTRPAKAEMRYQKNSLIDELRTWLSKKGDDRFPYFSFITERDEKALLQSH
jgi:hypothetical protein